MTGGGTHHRDVCVHGNVLSQCRCIGPKVDRLVACPPRCAGTPVYEAQHRAESPTVGVIIEGEVIERD